MPIKNVVIQLETKYLQDEAKRLGVSPEERPAFIHPQPSAE
jgi:hypothetical protein